MEKAARAKLRSSNLLSQRFALTSSGGAFTLQNKNSGLCLAAAGNVLTPGVSLNQAACSAASSELYKFP
jgi:hypothetical protein